MPYKEFEANVKRIIGLSNIIHKDNIHERYRKQGLEYVNIDKLSNSTELGLADGSIFYHNHESLDNKVVQLR